MADSNGKSLLNPAALARLSAQPLLARFPMEGFISGQHKSPHRGSSVEFAEYRNYVPGDDIRRLDWRVFGRTDRFYLKEFEAETNLRCHIVLDCSRSMAFEDAGGRKFDFATRLAATFAHLVIHQADAAGLFCVWQDRQLDLPARGNPAHMRLILDKLAEAEPEGQADLPKALHHLADHIRQRAMVVVISDLFEDPEALVNAFKHLRHRKHDLAVFQLVSRSELEFKFDRPIRFQDLESGASVVTEPSIIRQQYLQSLQNHLDLLKAGCHEVNADYRLVTAEGDCEQAIASFLVERARIASMR